uniref:Uncharacterized protein n=1 Tax=Rhizophora mucronata TaxID=61149 RepID=A0A2P2QCM3_RHIMU
MILNAYCLGFSTRIRIRGSPSTRFFETRGSRKEDTRKLNFMMKTAKPPIRWIRAFPA